MSLTASIDIGSEKIVMALVAREGSRNYRLTGVKISASQGVERGVVTDKLKAQACIRGLMNELIKDRHVESLNVALSGDAVRMVSREVTLPLPRKIVEHADLDRAEQKCADGFISKETELVDLVPVGYAVDMDDLTTNPVGKRGRNLTVYYRAYVADYSYVADLKKMFTGYDIQDVNFFPLARVYSEALDAEVAAKDFAVMDLGANSVKVAFFRDGMFVDEALLPLGVHSIDNDIVSAFGIDAAKARKLKHDYGQALRSACKNKKIVIPDTKLSIESRDLSTVIQCRMEEILEGAVFFLQSAGFDEQENEIILTGGGSRLGDVDLLLGKLSGQAVVRGRVKRLETSKEDALRTPEFFVALGLLLCAHEEPEIPKSGIFGKIKGLFR